MRTPRLLLLCLATALLAVSLPAARPTLDAQVAAQAMTRARQLFDFDWRFRSGDVENGQAPGLDDSSWQAVDLPHDFMIEGKGQALVIPNPNARAGGAGRGNTTLPTEPEGPFDPRSPGGSGNGYLNGGIGWYRKTFTPPASAASRRVRLEFEGVYMNSEVWLNGEKLGGRPYGYSTFELDITPHLKAGKPNTLAVRVYVPQPSSRWYSGAGIYRHVWLTLLDPIHVAQWGTVVTTPAVTDATAEVRVRSSVVNESAAAAAVDVDTIVLDQARREVARTRARVSIPAGQSAPVEATLQVPRPHRWSIGDPVPLLRLDAGARRRPRRGQRPDAVRHPHHRVHARGRFSPERHARAAAGRLPASRSRPAGRRRVRPRHRAAARDHEDARRQRHPHQPQSAGARAARSGGSHGLRRDGRGLRRMEAEQDALRLRPVLRRLERA